LRRVRLIKHAIQFETSGDFHISMGAGSGHGSQNKK
jgi:hypothetical protein